MQATVKGGRPGVVVDEDERPPQGTSAPQTLEEGRAGRLAAPDEEDAMDALRGSLVDLDARGMKRGDGGVRPAFDARCASEVETRIIVGIEVSGSDTSPVAPMLDELETAGGRLPC